MKFVRFIKNLFSKIISLLIDGLVFAAIASVFIVSSFCIILLIGYIEILLGVPIFTDEKLPYVGRVFGMGYATFLVSFCFGLFCVAVYKVGFWLRDIWRNS